MAYYRIYAIFIAILVYYGLSHGLFSISTIIVARQLELEIQFPQERINLEYELSSKTEIKH